MSEEQWSEDEFTGCDAYAPYNFSWIVENRLAGMACPSNKANIYFLLKNGIRQLITLSPEYIPSPYGSALKRATIPIEEFEAPSLEDMNRFVDICQKSRLKDEAVGVHCRMGRGRTGVMAACYLVRFEGFSPERAITEIRLKRPYSVETYSQERAVYRYFDFLRGTKVAN